MGKYSTKNGFHLIRELESCPGASMTWEYMPASTRRSFPGERHREKSAGNALHNGYGSGDLAFSNHFVCLQLMETTHDRTEVSREG